MKSWPQQRLRAFAEVKHGFAFKSQFFCSSSKYVLLTPGNFREEGGFRWLGAKQKFYSSDIPNGYVLKKDDLLIAMTEQAPGLLGSMILIPEDDRYLHNQRLGLLQINKPGVSRNFLYQVFNSLIVRRPISTTSAGTKVKHTSPAKIGNLYIPVPPIEQQTAIADLLSTWDAAIEKTEHLITAKQQQRKGLMQQLLHEHCDDWPHLKAREIFDSISEKNNSGEELLSVTQDKGVIPRRMLEGRVMSPAGSISGYKLIDVGDFSISLRSFQGGIEYSRYRGVISPAYTVLRRKIDMDDNFFRHFFKSSLFIDKYLRIAVIGIRDGKQVSLPDFMTVEIPNPPMKEQKQIACIFNLADKEISLLQKQLVAFKEQKKGIMQQLLTGKVRVKIAKKDVA